ncbi:MAG: hypothetical protein ACRCU3_01655 [Eubacteriaceae bacterium]
MRLSILKCWGLLFFDIVGFAISGYAFLLGYQIMEVLPNANAYLLLVGLFIGIKVLVMAFYDLNRKLLLKNIPFVGAFISILGNLIVVAIAFFVIKDAPIMFFVGLTLCDFLMILICHFIWWFLIGKEGLIEENDRKEDGSVEEKKGRKQKKEKRLKRQKVKKNDGSSEDTKSWLTDEDDEASEYDSIFTTLLENEKKRDRGIIEKPLPEMFEEEKRYQTGEFLNDIKRTLIQENTQGRVAPGKLGLETKKQMNEPRVPTPKVTEETVILPPAEKKILKTEEPEEKTFEISPTHNPALLEATRDSEISKIEKLSSGEETSHDKIIGLPTGISFNDGDDFVAIERRIGFLFHEIEKSMEETQLLQHSVSEFHQEVGNYTPIIGDEKIIATGNIIREKLKAIIDKQFIVDEVLDDLIRLSKLINNRIDDLDVIEAGLNQRKKALESQEALNSEERQRKAVDADIEIMSAEVVLENVDSEFIIAEEDYEAIRKYLMENPEE